MPIPKRSASEMGSISDSGSDEGFFRYVRHIRRNLNVTEWLLNTDSSEEGPPTLESIDDIAPYDAPIELPGTPPFVVQLVPSVSDSDFTMTQLNANSSSSDSWMPVLVDSPSFNGSRTSSLEAVQSIAADVTAVGSETDSGPERDLNCHPSPCCRHSDFSFDDSMLRPDELDVIYREDIPNDSNPDNHGKHDLVIANHFHRVNKVAFSEMYRDLQERLPDAIEDEALIEQTLDLDDCFDTLPSKHWEGGFCAYDAVTPADIIWVSTFKPFERVRMEKEYGVWAEHLDELVTVRRGIEVGIEYLSEILRGRHLDNEIEQRRAYPGSFLKALPENCSGIVTEPEFRFLVIVVDLLRTQGCHRVADEIYNTLRICFRDHAAIQAMLVDNIFHAEHIHWVKLGPIEEVD